MRRVAPNALLMLFALALLPTAQAGKAPPCVVDPSPVSFSQDPTYTVSAAGGVPFDYYEIIISQKFDGVTDEGRDALVQADETGFVTWTFQTGPWVDGDKSGLLVGDAKVAVSRYRTGGGPGGAASTIARCAFTVVE